MDKDIASRLRVTKAAVSGWRHEKSHPDADSVSRMCEATGDSVAHWLPLIEAERARNPAAKQVWLRLAQAAAVVTLALGLDVYSPKSHAETQVYNNATAYTLCEYRAAKEAAVAGHL